MRRFLTIILTRSMETSPHKQLTFTEQTVTLAGKLTDWRPYRYFLSYLITPCVVMWNVDGYIRAVIPGTNDASCTREQRRLVHTVWSEQ